MNLSTIELITLLQNESEEVKNSTGGTKYFRSVMDFITFNSSYEDKELCESFQRSDKTLAAMLEANFSEDILNNVKSIYSKKVIKNGMDLATQNLADAYLKKY